MKREMIISYDVPEENQIKIICEFTEELAGHSNILIPTGEKAELNIFGIPEHYEDIKIVLEEFINRLEQMKNHLII